MSESTLAIHRKIEDARELQSVVRAMKAVAASSIGQFEQATAALLDYYRTVEIALGASLRLFGADSYRQIANYSDRGQRAAIVFGSDQGLVGQFNEVVAGFAHESMGTDWLVWSVGERVEPALREFGAQTVQFHSVPTSVEGIAPLVTKLLRETEPLMGHSISELFLIGNRPMDASYGPKIERILPLDAQWIKDRSELRWPTAIPPESIGGPGGLPYLIREYLFVSIYRACAESMASENASRLAAMHRAEKNIQDLMEDLTRRYHRQRQRKIDEELFDVVAGFEQFREHGPTDSSAK